MGLLLLIALVGHGGHPAPTVKSARGKSVAALARAQPPAASDWGASAGLPAH